MAVSSSLCLCIESHEMIADRLTDSTFDDRKIVNQNKLIDSNRLFHSRSCICCFFVDFGVVWVVSHSVCVCFSKCVWELMQTNSIFTYGWRVHTRAQCQSRIFRSSSQIIVTIKRNANHGFSVASVISHSHSEVEVFAQNHSAQSTAMELGTNPHFVFIRL